MKIIWLDSYTETSLIILKLKDRLSLQVLTSHVPNYFVKVECVCLKFENGQSSVLRVISLFYATEDLGFFFFFTN